MMFSATFPKDARKLARECMGDDYYRVRIGRPGQSHKNIKQDVLWVDRDLKQEAMTHSELMETKHEES